MLKHLALGLCVLALAACGPVACTTTDLPDSGQVTMNAKKGALAARGAHYLICDAVVATHQTGVLTGSAFNDARKACIDADDALDVADASLAVGDAIRAAASVNRAMALIDTAQTASAVQPPQ